MDQQERRIYLINELVKEDPRLGKVEIPQAPEAQKRVLRSLMNIRPPEFSTRRDASPNIMGN